MKCSHLVERWRPMTAIRGNRASHRKFPLFAQPSIEASNPKYGPKAHFSHWVECWREENQGLATTCVHSSNAKANWLPFDRGAQTDISKYRESAWDFRRQVRLFWQKWHWANWVVGFGQVSRRWEWTPCSSCMRRSRSRWEYRGISWFLCGNFCYWCGPLLPKPLLVGPWWGWIWGVETYLWLCETIIILDFVVF